MDASSLGRRAGELRNNIWRLVLVKADGQALDVTGRKTACEPAMLATCRQIRGEATSM